MFFGICFLHVVAGLLQQGCFQAAPYPNFLPINAKQTDKSHWQKTTWGGYNLFHWPLIVYHEGNSGQELKAGISRQELEGNWQRSAACWLILHDSLCLLFLYNSSLPTQGWFSCWSLINKMPSRSCLSGYLMETSVSWGSLSPAVPSLCQVDKQLSSKIDPLSTWHRNTSLLNYNLSFLV